MLSGFIPHSRGSFTLDLVTASMLLVVPTLTTALAFAKKHRYLAHRNVQLALASILLVVIVLFEIEVRLYGWTDRAAASPYYDTILWPFLAFHLTVAVSTTVLWIVTIALALRNFPRPPRPGPHGKQHKRLGWAAAFGMYATAITGCIFYWIAFLA